MYDIISLSDLSIYISNWPVLACEDKKTSEILKESMHSSNCIIRYKLQTEMTLNFS